MADHFGQPKERDVDWTTALGNASVRPLQWARDPRNIIDRQTQPPKPVALAGWYGRN